MSEKRLSETMDLHLGQSRSSAIGRSKFYFACIDGGCSVPFAALLYIAVRFGSWLAGLETPLRERVPKTEIESTAQVWPPERDPPWPVAALGRVIVATLSVWVFVLFAGYFFNAIAQCLANVFPGNVIFESMLYHRQFIGCKWTN